MRFESILQNVFLCISKTAFDCRVTTTFIRKTRLDHFRTRSHEKYSNVFGFRVFALTRVNGVYYKL